LHITQKDFRSENAIPIQGDALNIPLKGNSVDFIFCSSLIEHIQDQNKLVSEIKRVLKPDGICYLSFPLFYSPVGGYQFKLFHLLWERSAIAISRLFKSVEAEDYVTSFGNCSLYPKNF
jgi:ubiquinone/menaquinone biosynthesis C-methylase UbiE